MVFILDPEDDDVSGDVDPAQAGVFRHYDPRPSQELERLTQEFLAQGGEIKRCAPTTRSRPLTTRRQEVEAEYARNMSRRKHKDERYAEMVKDDIAKVVAIREELARGTRGLRKMAEATCISSRVIERLVAMYGLPVCKFRRNKETEDESM